MQHHGTGVVSCIALVTIASVSISRAQEKTDYPLKPVRVIVASGAGGPSDVQARLLAQKLTEQLGQFVIPDNRTGAGGNLGLELGAKAAPDGYVITFTAPILTVSPALYAIHRRFVHKNNSCFP